jgi:hypothetical protein
MTHYQQEFKQYIKVIPDINCRIDNLKALMNLYSLPIEEIESKIESKFKEMPLNTEEDKLRKAKLSKFFFAKFMFDDLYRDGMRSLFNYNDLDTIDTLIKNKKDELSKRYKNIKVDDIGCTKIDGASREYRYFHYFYKKDKKLLKHIYAYIQDMVIDKERVNKIVEEARDMDHSAEDMKAFELYVTKKMHY